MLIGHTDKSMWRRVMSLVSVVILLAAGLSPGSASADAAGKGGDFVPANAVLLDTRNGTGGVTGARPAASTTTVTALGVGGVPASGVRALLVDVTAITPAGNTYLTVFPHGAARPVASSLNAAKGEVLSNSVVVAPGTDGKLDVYNHFDSAHIKLDVQGYFTTSTTGVGGAFVPVDHTRLVDTRTGHGTSTGPIGANGGSRTVTLTGGVIPTGASAAMIDVVVIGATALGHLAVAPANQASAANAIDYQAGITSMGMSVKLPADGQVVLTNRGASTVHVLVSVQGYFTAAPTTGAGLRTLTAGRLLDTRTVGAKTPLPAGGTVDVAIGGTNGLPTRAIAGAVLNLTAVSPTATGHLSVWPLDATPTSVSAGNFSTGQVARSGLAVTKVGAEGKVRVRNNSSGTVHLLVDLQAWFADPMPELTPLPFARMAVVQGESDGTQLRRITLAFTDNAGRLLVGTMDPDQYGQTVWAPASGREAYTGPPSLHQRVDKGVQVAAQNIDTNIWSTSENTGTPYTWPAPSNLGGSMAGPPTGAQLVNRIEGHPSSKADVLFAVDADGRLWHYRQSGTSPAWASLGDADLASQVAVANEDEGSLRLVARTITGTVKTATYFPDGALSSWTDLAGDVTGTPAVVSGLGGRTRIVVRAADGSIRTKVEVSSTSWSTDWERIGDFTAAGSPAVVLDPVLTRTAVVARGHDNEMYVVFETNAGSNTWGQWKTLNPNPDVASDNAATDPAIATISIGTAPGQAFIVVFRNQNGGFRIYRRELSLLDGGSWSTARIWYTGHTQPAPPAD
ncbi:hypothetical protein [Micromonospora sp. KC721]|uniref:hypothetical protein n=1 Tax=Micromonospora sp. KC721 TaxID=2530380 RepID=UPI001048C3DA|nr:hypothetical protein [Micromonospora sp. KC721]TDB79096.1 hypothetical protein E1182_13940 [Micromonospora sp. KC721]